MKIKTYTIKEVAKMFHVSEATIRREIERGNLRCFKVGNEARFTPIHLEEYMNVKNLGKTTREIELEKEIEELKVIIENKNKIIEEIKNLLLKEVSIYDRRN